MSFLTHLKTTALQQLEKFTGAQIPGSTETGYRPNPEKRIEYLYRRMWVDPELRAAIQDIRIMDNNDTRVKKIHGRMSRTAVKGGLLIETSSDNKRLINAWKAFEKRLHLNRQEKLESDCRGLIMEGNLPMQWVLDHSGRVVKGVRMPSETILPNVSGNGQFINPAKAYEQYNLSTGTLLTTFSIWQLSLIRLTPLNYDDEGSMGRPYLDSARTLYNKLTMTEEDLVIRRHTRAAQRFSHVLEGADDTEVKEYEAELDNKDTITTDFVQNRKGGVTALAGDASLAEVADILLLLDAFFAGAPAPKGLFGYADELNRDILEDLKRDYFDEIDSLQDTLSMVYELGFRLDLLLQGINPDAWDWSVKFAERNTETPNQRVDRALKLQALNYPKEAIIRTVGDDPAKIKAQKIAEEKASDPYPEPHEIGPAQGGNIVKITPGNQPKGESATSINNN